jgi:RNA-directed DNA polymerase
VRTIEKEGGGFRQINVFQLPDAALSRLIYKSLLRKNLSRFSSYAYAYREERSAHDAVYRMFSEWKLLHRVYVAEFDFTKFFDNISHKHIWDMLDKYEFLVTDEERFVMETFLNSKAAPIDDYSSSGGEARRKGIPQGTSISLFLANVACWKLDHALERLGVGFCRYADDTVIWSESYSKTVKAYELIKEYGDKMEVPINVEKSGGISLVTNQNRAEISFKSSVDYLGYGVSLSSLSFNDKSVKEIKEKLSYLAYQNLLQPLKQGIYNRSRLSGIDWDYLIALDQIRRYLYGGLTDRALRLYLRGQIPQLNFRGLMSYYPLVNDFKQISMLDGWLIYMLKQCLLRREQLWRDNQGMSLPGPQPDWIANLTRLKFWTDSAGTRYDLRIPSFALINKAMQVGIKKMGVAAVSSPINPYYHS